MPASFRYPQLVLRLSLALVFLWLGISKFIQPQYWVDAWLPQGIGSLMAHVHIAARDIIFMSGMFEVLVAVSLATGFFLRWFAGAAALGLLTVGLFHGINEVLIRDVGLIGGLVALILWPERTYI